MVSLLDSCDLNIEFDNENGTLTYGDGVTADNKERVHLKNITPTLLNKALSYPEEVYEEHSRVRRTEDTFLSDSDLSFDLLSLPAGLLGIEFVKTHIFFAPKQDGGKFSCLVEVIYGVLTVILQKNAPKDELDFETHVAEGYLIKVHAGEKLAIPEGYFYTFINTEDFPLLFVRVHRKKGIVDYNLLRHEHGLAYYCIRKNARQEIVNNPLYRDTPKINELDPWEFFNKIQLERELALYRQLRAQIDELERSLWG